MTIDLSRAHLNNPFRQPRYTPASAIFTESGYPMNGSQWLGFGVGGRKVNAQIVHYPGSLYSGYRLSAAAADVIRRLRESNRSSWNSRGYALYYSFDLPTDGSLYGIREFSIRNAANADDDKTDGNENDWSYSVHSIFNKVDGTSTSNVTVEPTWDQLETLRWLRWEAREYGIEATGDPRFQIAAMPHCDIKPTGCCGDKAIAAIRAGALTIPDRNTTAPIEEDDDMAVEQLLKFAAGDIDPAEWGDSIVLRGAGPARRVNDGEVAHLIAKLGAPRLVVPGTNEHNMVAAEIRAYDKFVA